MILLVCLFALTCAFYGVSAGPLPPTRLRVEYLPSPLTIDVASPRFSWALEHLSRGERQTAYRVIVSELSGTALQQRWDSGIVKSSRSVNVPYPASAAPLDSDTDYVWTVSWWDSANVQSPQANGSFSTALLTDAAWAGAEWLSPADVDHNPAANTLRAEFNVTGEPTRARLYIAGLGYWKATLNSLPVDAHELGSFTTFEMRVLYDVVDVTPLVRAGCNAIGVMLGHGWYSQPSVSVGHRALRMVLVVTAGGRTVTFASSRGSTQPGVPLLFHSTTGPVLSDDIYDGETYDGRVAASLRSSQWASCAFNGRGTWVPAIAPPGASPLTLGSVLSAQTTPILADRSFSVDYPGGIAQPGPGIFVFDFHQTMAGVVTLRVADCPAGTSILLQFAEILYANGSVHNHYWPGAKMLATYICAGEAVETYRTHFTYYGFRYCQVAGYPGIPTATSLVAHFVHSAVPQAGAFSSASAMLNAVQYATRSAHLSNLVDIPTDCPQRERRGWMGDAQLSCETAIYNSDMGAIYTKWLRDQRDSQFWNNKTLHTHGALPDCVPFYGHGNPESDPGWGFAFFAIPDWFASYYSDERIVEQQYPGMVDYIEHWIGMAASTGGILTHMLYGDWGNYFDYSYKTPEYPQYFYIRALEITAKFALLLGDSAAARRYTGIAAAARQVYQKKFYNSSNHRYGKEGAVVSQAFALDLGLPAAGSELQGVLDRLVADYTDPSVTSVPGHNPGGIVAMKMAYSIFPKLGLDPLGLQLIMPYKNDTPPSFETWIDRGATTLWESWILTPTSGGASYNHIMFGGQGSWFYSSLAGISRAADSSSWSDLVIAPPTDLGMINALQWVDASVDSPMGLISTQWALEPNITVGCATALENNVLSLSCPSRQAFTRVDFASFGTPTGNCSSGFQVSNCNAANSKKIVERACVGKSSCSIVASDTIFGDPCPGTLKLLSVQLGGCPQAVGVRYSLKVTIPTGASGKIVVPSIGSPASRGLTIKEGGVLLWTAGSYRGGVAGISGATADGNSVAFSAGSGSFAFEVIVLTD